MPTPRTSIDELPTKVTPESDDLLIIQDSGVTKSTTVGGLSSLPSAALTTHINNPTDAHDASAVSALDAGNGVNGANVQAQLGQLSTLAKGGNDAAAAADAKIVAHMADALDAHDASAISAIAGAILTGVDVQAQLAQIETVLSQGTVGPEGPQGPAGPGVPTGGTAGQLLSKVNSTDFLTQWESPLWLPLAGGTLTGPLIINEGGGTPPLHLRRSTNNPSVVFEDQAGASFGYVAGAVDKLDVACSTNLIRFILAGGSKMEINGTQALMRGISLILDTGNLEVSAGAATFKGNTFFQGTTNRITRPGSTRPFIEFYDTPSGSRQGVLVGSDTGFEIGSDTGPITFQPSGVATHALSSSAAWFGKTSSSASVAGVEINCGASEGRIQSIQAAANINAQLVHISAADVSGASFVRFDRTTSSTPIGNITQSGTTGVAYGTTSDERLKTFTREVDDDEALQKVRDMRPLHFVWKDAPDEGEQIGFFAQELYGVAPEAVLVGSGEPGDLPDEDGNGGFVPWGTDVGKLVPRIVAAMQAMDNKMAAMRAEIAELRGQLGAQPA